SKSCGYRVVVVTGCLLESLGVIISCFTIQSSFVGVLITYSLIKGAGISFGYSVVIAVATAWFPTRRGLVVGLIVGGFGLGPLVFAPIQKAFINPENVKVNEETKQFTDDKLTYHFSNDAAACQPNWKLFQKRHEQFNAFSLQTAEQTTAKTKTNNNAAKKTMKAVTDQSRSTASPPVSSQTAPPPASVSVPSSAPPDVLDEENIPPKEVLRCPNFYLLWVVMFCSIIPTTILTSAFKYFGQKLIQDDQFLTAVAATSSVFNAGGRVVWGLIIDKLSFKMPLCILLILWASFLVTFPHVGLTEGLVLQGLYFFWVCAMFFLLSGIFTIMPAATSTLFGPVNLAVNYGMLFTAFSLGSLVCAGVSSAAGGDDPYLYQFTGCGCACIVGLLVTIWIEDKKMHPKLNVIKCFTGQCAKRPTEQSRC
ncbi:Oxalate:formate antiporter, partial [Paragonimus heterotremus]